LHELVGKATNYGDFNHHWRQRGGRNNVDELFLACVDEGYLTMQATEPKNVGIYRSWLPQQMQ